MATYTLPTDEDARYASLAVLRILRQLADNIVGLKVGEISIDDITEDIGNSLRSLVNESGEPSERVTDAAVALVRMLEQIANEPAVAASNRSNPHDFAIGPPEPGER